MKKYIYSHDILLIILIVVNLFVAIITLNWIAVALLAIATAILIKGIMQEAAHNKPKVADLKLIAPTSTALCLHCKQPMDRYILHENKNEPCGCSGGILFQFEKAD